MGLFHKEFPELLLEVHHCNHDIFDTNLQPVVYLVKSHSEHSRLFGRWFVADPCLEGSVCWPGLCLGSSMNVSANFTIMLCVVVVVAVPCCGGDDCYDYARIL
jgi:hypothetical protein